MSVAGGLDGKVDRIALVIAARMLRADYNRHNEPDMTEDEAEGYARRVIVGYLNSASPPPSGWDLIAHLERQRKFSLETFGPGARTQGVLDHIRKELAEIEADPQDISEWVDVILLALDGAWRAGWGSRDIAEAISAKQTKNEARDWPDWRTADPNKAIEHDRSAEQ